MRDNSDNYFDKKQLKIGIHYENSEPWTVINKQTYKQKDGHNCEPIACLKVLEKYGFLPTDYIKSTIEKNSGDLRSIVNR